MTQSTSDLIKEGEALLLKSAQQRAERQKAMAKLSKKSEKLTKKSNKIFNV